MNTTNIQNKTEYERSQGKRQFPYANGKNPIEAVVMARVRRIHLMRSFINPTALKVYGAGVLYVTLISTVSMGNVYANMPSLVAPKELFTFVLRAVLNTEMFVQFVLVGLVSLVSLCVLDVVRNSKESKVFFTRAQA